MQVAYWYNNQDIRIEEIPTPKPGPKEMLVRVMSCGICGSDVVEWYRLPRAPLVLGHEIGAQVVDVGKAVKKFKPGDRVFIAPKVTCGKCHYCKNGHHPQCSEVRERLPGGFAEYILVPEILVKKGTYRLPDHISDDQSTFIEPLACVIRAQRLARIQKGQNVLVIGCGMSGLLHVKLAKKKGCRVIAADVNRFKLETAKRLGADLCVSATENLSERLIQEIGRKADAVFVCAAAEEAAKESWLCVDKGGVILFFAVPGPDKQIVVPLNDFWMKEITILTSYYCGPPDIAEAMKCLARRQVNVDDLITHRLSLAEIAKGFQLVSDGRSSIKIIIKPNG